VEVHGVGGSTYSYKDVINSRIFSLWSFKTQTDWLRQTVLSENTPGRMRGNIIRNTEFANQRELPTVNNWIVTSVGLRRKNETETRYSVSPAFESKTEIWHYNHSAAGYDNWNMAWKGAPSHPPTNKHSLNTRMYIYIQLAPTPTQVACPNQPTVPSDTIAVLAAKAQVYIAVPCSMTQRNFAGGSERLLWPFCFHTKGQH
jgi:hypothetical protein